VPVAYPSVLLEARRGGVPEHGRDYRSPGGAPERGRAPSTPGGNDRPAPASLSTGGGVIGGLLGGWGCVNNRGVPLAASAPPPPPGSRGFGHGRSRAQVEAVALPVQAGLLGPALRSGTGGSR